MKEVIQVAPVCCGLHVVRDLFFSRKNFSRPEEQSFPHYSFDAEVAFLDDILSHRGIAYTLGRINGDAWHLYMLDHHSTPPGTPSSGLQSPASLMSSSTTTNDDDDNAPATPPATVVARTQPKAAVMADQTLEVIMTHLPLETMVQFYKLHDFVDSKTTTKTSGIATIFPEAVTDEVMFDPCGYSVNGVLDDCYFTIHITPQPECSYVSFETNIHTQPFTCVVNKVLRLFQPGRVSVSVFATEQSSPDAALHPTALHGYRPLDRQSCSLPHYTLDYFHFVRASSDLSPSST
jgi:S-adenosylmethionine decarboxylase